MAIFFFVFLIWFMIYMKKVYKQIMSGFLKEVESSDKSLKRALKQQETLHEEKITFERKKNC